ncbi:sugar phosphate isomerase/epimerase [Paenibacillus taihuensis]|uniref:Sugar phosphate isomerase/epimerase n=1 Tax=Paenibacillus taihuensis TaxID=1156355 RepID=A0A3D9S3M3_9BACL|nr:sugar phosphate isomerase/epimerase family protein [Paenibacillus taihuensis]REE87368.1 sugar phosphate isomerase/epimerase [Paenibacillus taihuensis]
MRFALQDRLIGKSGYKDIFEEAGQLGYDGVEITHHGAPLTQEAADDIIVASERSGVAASAVCGGYRHWIGDFNRDQRLEAVAGIAQSMEQIKRIGAQGLIAPAAFGIISRGVPLSRDAAGDQEALLDSLSRIAEKAEQIGVYLLLEPLNRYEDHMINRVEQAVSLIERTGSSRIKVMADFFHMNIEEADLTATIEQHYNHIGYFHLADSARKEPGTGHTDFRQPFAKLQELRYDGFLSLECGLSGERSTSLAGALHYLKVSAQV